MSSRTSVALSSAASSLEAEHRAPLQGFLQQAAILLVFQLPWHSASFLWRDGIDDVGSAARLRTTAVQLIWTNGFRDLWTFKTIPPFPHEACAAGQPTGMSEPRGDACVLECEDFSRSCCVREGFLFMDKLITDHKRLTQWYSGIK